MLAHLLKYDSVHGILEEEVTVNGDALVVGGKEVKVLSERDPANLPWGDLGVEIVVESTGIFVKHADASNILMQELKKLLFLRHLQMQMLL